MTNHFADLPWQLHVELCITLPKTTNIRIKRVVSYGHALPEGYWFDQDEHEWVVVLKTMLVLDITPPSHPSSSRRT